jgi:hypothetical protein
LAVHLKTFLCYRTSPPTMHIVNSRPDSSFSIAILVELSGISSEPFN